MHYAMTIFFLTGMIFGISFFILTKPEDIEMKETRESYLKSLGILKE